MNDRDRAREQSLKLNLSALVTILAFVVIWYEILNRVPALWFVLVAPFILICLLAPFLLIAMFVRRYRRFRDDDRGGIRTEKSGSVSSLRSEWFMDDRDHAREQSLKLNFPALVTILGLVVMWCVPPLLFAALFILSCLLMPLAFRTLVLGPDRLWALRRLAVLLVAGIVILLAR